MPHVQFLGILWDLISTCPKCPSRSLATNAPALQVACLLCKFITWILVAICLNAFLHPGHNRISVAGGLPAVRLHQSPESWFQPLPNPLTYPKFWFQPLSQSTFAAWPQMRQRCRWPADVGVRNHGDKTKGQCRRGCVCRICVRVYVCVCVYVLSVRKPKSFGNCVNACFSALPDRYLLESGRCGSRTQDLRAEIDFSLRFQLANECASLQVS
eukprot:1159269-Pelagomonas_calceolata.AAC.9